MSYTLMAGEFVIRYADQPRNGPEPDGDTVRFAPDRRELVEALPRLSGRAPQINARGNVAVRLEAVDTLETHFGGSHQELAGANAARDRLLAALGFTNVTFWADLPNRVQSADQDSVRGTVLSNGIDANGRVIGFGYAGDPVEPDGSDVFVDEARVGASLNADLLASGDAYPAFYATLPVSLRTALATVSRAARDGQPPAGLWPRSTADPNGPATIADLNALETFVIWPKLFRRIVPFLASGFTDFDGFDAWLRAEPVDRDDELFLLDRLERGNLHDVVRAAGQDIALTVWPEDFIISPDPSLGAPVAPPRPIVVAADILIVAALPDPTGADPGHETVTLLNASPASVDLTGWAIADAAGGRHALAGTLNAGDTQRVQLSAAVQLANTGDTIAVADAAGQIIDQVAYQPNQVRPGRTISFGS